MKITANNKPLITIITSIYNTEKYLAKCIDSILGQTYNNIELILVNDGSTDNSKAICEDYQVRDNRITLINKENTGAADSRNIAIDRAKGAYISFVDSDDYVDKDFINILFKNIVKYKAKISACNYCSIYDDEIVNNDKPELKKFSNLESVKDVLLENSILETMIWNKMFKKSLFVDNNLKMPIGEIYEDTRIIYKLNYYAKDIVFTNKMLYYYVQRNDSVMKHGVKLSNLMLLTKIVDETNEWLSQRTDKLHSAINAYKLTGQINSLNYMVDGKKIYNDIWKSIINEIKKDRKKYLSNPYISKNRKILVIISALGKVPYIIIRNKYVKSMSKRKGILK